MGFGTLRVINEDRVAAGHGLRHPRPPRHGDHQLRAGRRARAQGQHGHRLDHPAGRRAAHERRHAACSTASSTTRGRRRPHFLQIWIEPNERGIAPGYEQKHFPDDEKRGRLRLVASPDGADGSVRIHQDARLYAGLFDGDENAELDAELRAARATCTWRAAGIDVERQKLDAGDAAMIEDESSTDARRRQGCRSAGVRSAEDVRISRY